MKILKYAAAAVAALLVLGAAALAYIVATFDPNDYKAQIVRLVKEKKDRTLRLEGDIRLSFWPDLGADLGRLALSERGSEQAFAAIESARVSVKLLPLLARRVVVDEIALKGARVALVRHPDGRTNMDDLFAPQDEAQTGYALDIARIRIEDSALSFRDEASGARYTLSRLELRTGRLAPGVPARVALSGVASAVEPRFDLGVNLETMLVLGPARGELRLEELVLAAKGEAAGLRELVLKAAGSLALRLEAGHYTARRLSVSAAGAGGGQRFEAKLEAPAVALGPERAGSERISATAKLAGPGSTLSAALSLTGLEGTVRAFKSEALALDLEFKRGGLSARAKLASPLEGDVKARRVSLPRLEAGLAASGLGAAADPLAGKLAGSMALDAAKGTARAALAGRIAESNVKAQFALAGFAPPAVKFDIAIDQLDLDRYFPAKGAGGAPAAGGGAKRPEQPFDLSGLEKLRASGTLRIGSLRAANLKASGVRLEVKAANGRLEVNPIQAGLYQGTLAGALSVDAAGAVPAFALRQQLTAVSVGPLLRDLAGRDALEGRGNVTLELTSQGRTLSALGKAMNGSAAIRLADGAVRGVDIAGSIRSARARLGALRGEHTQGADVRQKTDFTELTASFRIANGVARNHDLSLKSPLLRVSGEGEIDLGEHTLDYLVKASLVATMQGQGGRERDELAGVSVPVRIAGPLAAPSYRFDFAAAAAEGMKRGLAQRLTGRLGGEVPAAPSGAPKKEAAPSGGGLRETVRGLFGR
jgi:AsmA protein